MPLKILIDDDLKSFMRAKDTYALEIIRLLKTDIKNSELSQRGELNDDEVVRCVKTLIKKHTEALEIFLKAGRADLAEKEQKYLDVLAKYMPKMADEAEINRCISETLAELAPLDPKKGFGLVMKSVMGKLGTAADGKVISEQIKKAMEEAG
ncbi:MAG: GatB/YqeY domain-containing protein [Deferribacteraceae bacterium]|jgi:uncharacterized protein YqeY|nr:GatB/YqeY domain-containing protein [Deferribacteraceae bacterium]